MMGKPEEKRQLVRPKYRWKDNIKMYLQELGWSICIGFVWLSIGSRGELMLKRTVMKITTRNCHNTLHNIPEERRSILLRGESLK
jgi:hypothetical protein